MDGTFTNGSIGVETSLSDVHTLREVLPLLFLPESTADAGKLAEILGVYAQANYWYCIVTMFFVFVTLQSFNIPGTVFLNVMMGCLFGYLEGVSLGVLSGTCGAMIAYTISSRWGGGVVNWVVRKTGMESKMTWFSDQVAANDNIDLLLFLVFLRISPVLPNWFINAVSPHVGVPPMPLAVATAIGIAPQTFLAVHGGLMLRELISSGQSHPLGPREWCMLSVLAICVLIPLWAKKRFNKKSDPQESRQTSRSPSVAHEEPVRQPSPASVEKPTTGRESSVAPEESTNNDE
eukprot:TRINITY_DN3595_c1_g1_i1.p1 TRINITY_DN3595_c1_g1~~TRINITY_DN3595_c1_g1_i1.p1  ORF type:complete len:316 (+),score=46.55 TRINITY_DN3595_c1_g1_i1:78-950(+)